jgi:dethiobiotin synthetase
VIICVTGTDTDVGKTLVTAGIARAARSEGMRVVAIKPVESGCREGHPGDGERLAEAAGQKEPLRALQRYREPLAPPMAAEQEEGAPAPDPKAWIEAIREAAENADLTLVEGAGGLTSPLAWDWDLRDLALELEASLIVVASNRIGVLHQLRAVVELAEAGGLGIAALVLSAAPENPSDPSPATNPELVRRVLGRYPLLVMPRVNSEEEVAELYGAWMASQSR